MSCDSPGDNYISVYGSGCDDPAAINYAINLLDPQLQYCLYYACVDQTACNHLEGPTVPDGFAAQYPNNLQPDFSLCTYPSIADFEFIWCLDEQPQNGLCDPNQLFVQACEIPEGNYIAVTVDNQSEILGCTDNSVYDGPDEDYPSDIYLCGSGNEQCLASNYNPDATYNYECDYPIQGCTNALASNYNSMAISDNGTCEYLNDSWVGVNEYGNPYYYPVIPRFNKSVWFTN